MNNKTKGIGFYIIVLIVLMGTIAVLLDGEPQPQASWSDIVLLFEEQKVKAVTVDGDDLLLELRDGTILSHAIPKIGRA